MTVHAVAALAVGWELNAMSLKTAAELLSDMEANMPTGVLGGTSALDVRTAIDAASNNTFNFKSDKIYNVRAFGVTGNGTTDDTTNIAACFAAAPAGATIFFPPGTYKMTSYVTITADYQTVIGYGAKIISNATGQDQKFLVSGRIGIRFHGLRIDGGELTDVTPATSWYTYGPRWNPGTIHFVDSVNCSVIDGDFTGVNWPITILGACDCISVIRNRFNRYYCAVQSSFSGEVSEDEISPLRILVAFNNFGPGLHPLFPVAPIGSDRDYTLDIALDTGAVKIRGHEGLSIENGRFYEKHGHRIIANSVNRPGDMGIEIQSCNDCVVDDNQIYHCATAGISLSFVQRSSACSNTISDCVYTGIEIDGRVDLDPDQPSSENIALTGNVIDGRDEFGRFLHWVVVNGIIVDHASRNITITGGSVNGCLTGIKVRNQCDGVTIDGVRIITNDQSGYGGDGDYTGGPWNQGIFIKDSKNVRLRGLTLTPYADAWQKMVNIETSADIKIEDCDIKANNCCIYITACDRVSILGGTLELSDTLGGADSTWDFITVNGADGSCTGLLIQDVKFKGDATDGINLFAPANTITGVEIERCNTTAATVTISAGFVFKNTFPVGPFTGGSIGTVAVRDNYGPAASTKFNSIIATLDLSNGTVNDGTLLRDVYLTSYTTTINLRSAVGADRKRITIFYWEGTGNLTLHPASGEKINNSTSDVVYTAVNTSVTLMSDGSGWLIVG